MWWGRRSHRAPVPLRIAEARVTLGTVAAREGDLEAAVHYGSHALVGERKSLPHLLMCSRELASILRQRFSDAPATGVYLEELGALAATARQASA